jgi:imidazolonepropionase-like amidohydrolase
MNSKLIRLALIVSLILSTSAFAAEKAKELPKQTLFNNVNVFNGTDNKLYKNHSVLVEGNKIKAISSKAIKVNGKTTIIDGKGKTLMPGLIDSHVHFNMLIGGLKDIEAARWDRIASIAAHAAKEWLMDGFTTVRGMGGMGNGLKVTIDEGLLNGPRIYPSGSYISQTSGHGDVTLGSQQQDPKSSNFVRLGITTLADGPDAVRATVRKNFALGASQIKIMVGGGISSEKGPMFASQYTDEEIRTAVEEAATRDTYVAVHVYHAGHIKRALEQGVKSIEHGQFIDEATAELLKKKGAFISPYINGLTPEALLHPAYSTPGTPQNIKALEFQALSKNFIDVIKKVKPKVVFAADVVSLNGENARRNRDFEKFAFARAFGNYAALIAMTSTAGELAALTGKNNPYPQGKLGVIEVGAYADIILLEGNPLEDITVIGANSKYFDAPARDQGIETIKLIMKDGKIYKNTL